MNLRTMYAGAATMALATTLLAGPAQAVPVLCENIENNHTYIDSTQVSSCLGAGVGNVNGNPATDVFLTSGGGELGWVGIGSGSWTQTGSTGTFSLSPDLWSSWSSIAVGLKFGTGNRPDEWFVYLLNPSVSSGDWEFVNVFGRGDGLSHVQLYGSGPANVPEPGALALLGIGLLGAGFAKRRKVT